MVGSGVVGRVHGLAVACLGATLLFAFGVARPDVAEATCSQSQDLGIFTREGSNTYTQHGDQATILVKDSNPRGDCTQVAWLVVEGTTHMHIGPPGSNTFAEIGWIEVANSSGTITYLFWETEINGVQGNANAFTSGCAAGGTDTQFKVGNDTGTQWAMDYACNGGGFTHKAETPTTGYTMGQARGETTHHSNPVPKNGLDDHFQDLRFKNGSGAWPVWSGIGCDNDGGLSNFFVNRIPDSSGHEYYTGDGSGFC